MEQIVVVGASLAGLRTAETLRNEGYEGSVTVIGAEPHLPYDRPPLSKKVLAGVWEPERVALRRPDDMGSLDVEWRLGTRATGLDLAGRVVRLGDHDGIGFDGLVLACGAAPKMLPGVQATRPDTDTGSDTGSDTDSEGPMITALRTLDDSLALRRRIAGGHSRVVVVGAGFIGLEVAATARGLGNDVVVLEGAGAPLVRALGEEMGHAVAACHGDHGVDIRCGVSVGGVDADGVHLGDGSVVPADVVVIGIGVAPCTDWLEDSGLDLRDGVVCDSTLAVTSSDGADTTGVYAAGDVVRWQHPLFDEEVRIEHWTNAADQGAVAAKNLLALARGADPQPYGEVPFFWSDQYDRRIQFLGHASPADEVRVVHGSIDERRFLALFGRDGRLRGALGLNVPRLVMSYRSPLADRISWDDALARAAEQAG
ncbi:MAG: FAD-dependent oxidoreductase [Ilumatobacteraceae bacterium]